MEQRIKELFRKYLSNTCTEDELNEFFHCIRMSDHDETLRQILEETFESVLIGSDTYVNKSGDLVIPGNAEPPVPAVNRKKNRHLKLALACLGAIAFISLIYLLNVQLDPKKEPLSAVMKKTSTERAEYKYILLPDSTQVWLNAGSVLEYPDQFDKKTREVTLSGEAYFDVKHAAEHPFIIYTGEIMTTVLGTAFNINAYSDHSNIKVSVSRGKVKVSRGNQLVAMLLKDQELIVSQKKTEKPQKVFFTSSIAEWQQGNMVYDDEQLSEIIADLQRVYNADIQIKDEKIRSLRVSTRFRRELGVGMALDILCKLTDTQLFEKNGTYLIQ